MQGESTPDEALHFELDVQPETTRSAWHAWLRRPGVAEPVEFDSPLALLRFLAHLNPRLPGVPQPPGLR